jgi:integral membrane protein (TIGR01906 family)
MPDRKHWRILVYIAIGLFILCIPLSLITSHLTWAINDLQLHEQSFYKYNVSLDTGLSQEELHEVAVGLISYFNSGETSEALDIFSEREMLHLRDVRGLIILNYRLQEAVCGYIALFLIAGLLWLRRRFLIPLAKMALGGGVLTLIVIVVLGIAALVDFDWLFVSFHRIIFSNDYWILAGYLPRIFTAGFFSDTAMLIATAIAIESLFLGGIGGFFVIRERRKARA